MGVTEGPSHVPECGARGGEPGYSLVEVLVAIVILSLAILPMLGMFDTALRAAVLGGNYDKARALANEKLEEVRALPYSNPGGAPDSVTEKYPPASPTSGTEGIFTYSVQTSFVDAGLSNPGGSSPTSQMRVEVEVEWQGNSYTTTGFVAGI
ncbi:MAG: prepilin-type N-terminal cleavage/methylation domain-containing protein [Actinobacteria bacterium]|nr:prepilin-type N-terminal cleavage/methylation domain-containing protein [Actinomycetota bacterium]